MRETIVLHKSHITTYQILVAHTKRWLAPK